MATLAEELPFAAAVDTSYLETTCSYCLSDADIVRKCLGCRVLYYCSEECQKSDWPDHRKECSLLKNLKNHKGGIPSAKVRLVSRILLKSSKQLNVEAFNGRTWDSLEDHVEDLKSCTEKGINFLKFCVDISNIRNFLEPLKTPSRDEIEKALGKVNTNAFSTTDSATGNGSIGSVLYLGLSIHDHSCIPDCQFISIGNRGILRSIDPEKTVYSTDHTISYIPHFPHLVDRKKKLWDNFFFECTCLPCVEENHIFNQMGSSCAVTCCNNAAGIRNFGSSDPYKCNKCGQMSAITPDQVSGAQKKIEKMLLNPDYMVDYRSKLKLSFECRKVLSFYNYHLVDLFEAIEQNARMEGYMKLSVELLDAVQPAYEFYFPEGHKERTRHLLAQAYHRFNTRTGIEMHLFMRKAYDAAKHTYGEEHHLTKRQKSICNTCDKYANENIEFR